MRGGQWQVLRLIAGLSSAGIESTLLARAEGPLFAAAHKEGWRVEPIGLTRAVRELRGHDLIHAHDARSHTMATLLRSRPLVVARRVAFPVGSRWKYGKARRYIAVSEFVKGVLIEGGVAPGDILVTDGVDKLQDGTSVTYRIAKPTSRPTTQAVGRTGASTRPAIPANSNRPGGRSGRRGEE